MIEKCGKAEQGSNGEECEHNAVTCEETVLGYDRLIRRATRSNQSSIAVNEEVEDERVNDGVNLEMDAEAVSNSSDNIPLAKEEEN